MVEHPNVEEALRLSEQRYSLAMQASGEGHWDWDTETDLLFMSERAQRIYGLEPGPTLMPRSKWVSMVRIHPDDEERRRRAIDEFIAGTAEAHDEEFRALHRDGSYRWMRSRAVRAQNSAGSYVRFAGCVTDIEDERRARTALERVEERYLFADAAGDGHTDWIVATDEFYVSPRYMETCGIPPDTVIGGRAGFISKFPYHPDDRERVVREMTAHYAGTATRLETEMRIIVRGEVRWTHVKGVCTRDGSGAMVRWTALCSDITERKRAEEALRQSEERFELAVAASNEGIWAWDIRQDAMYFSERAQCLYGLMPGPTVRPRADWLALVKFHPEDVASRLRLFDDYLAGAAPAYDGEWRIQLPSGEYRWVHIRGLCVRDADGRPTRMAGSVGDIDTQKRSEAASRQRQRLESMGTLAGGIAHDFNNILGSVLGYGEMALRDVDPGTRLRRDLDRIMVAGERGRALVARVLAFSRSGPRERSAVHVEGVVVEVLELLAPGLPEGVEIVRRLEAGRAAMLGDATQVHQVVMNLTTNALQAMPHGGVLAVTLQTQVLRDPKIVTTGTLAPGPYVVLSVEDNGEGIPKNILDRIFDPFFTTKDVGIGNGLGLSLVHGIVTEVRGAVNVVSERGAGSLFTVYLPQDGEAQHKADGDVPVPRGSGQRVLVVDDEEPLLNLMIETLADLGYRPQGYHSSTNALEAFKASPEGFDAVVTDLRMPGLDGASLVRAMRSVRPGIPIVLVSGFLGADALATAKGPGATEMLMKPLSRREMAVSLGRVLRR